nr:substrate-binding domain-containing protein [Deinococcus betulae]
MSAPPTTQPPQVRARREQLGLRAGECARLTGITRQALHAIETGAYVPNTLTALQLARVLSCCVEDLFALAPAGVQARLVGQAPPPARVRLAQVGPELLAFPLSGQAGLGEAADGLAQSAAGGLAQVELLGDPQRAAQTLVVAGCDPALSLLGTHAARQEGHLLLRPLSSLAALRALAAGEAHAAGIHLYDARSGVSNLPFVERALPDRAVHVLTLWMWEQGLMVAPGNPCGVTGVEDLLRPGLRLQNREPDAGSRLLLDSWLDAAGIGPERRLDLAGYGHEVGTPLAAAERVAAGAADVAPGPRSAALALGLDFVPLQTERFDLVVPDEFLAHPGLHRLLAAVRQPAFRSDLCALGGYDPAHAGDLWQTVGPAPQPPKEIP